MARLGAAMVACLTLFVAMAAAAGPVEFIGAVTDQRARLVIKALRVLPFANDQIGRGLILTFDPPLRGDPASAQAALRGFVEAMAPCWRSRRPRRGFKFIVVRIFRPLPAF